MLYLLFINILYLYICFDVFVIYSSYSTSLKMATKVAETCRRFTTLILQ